MINTLILFNTLLFIFLIIKKNNFLTRIILIFFSIYYIFPPLMYFIFVSHYNYISMSNSLLFKSEIMNGISFPILLILTFIFLLFSFMLPSKEKKFIIKKDVNIKIIKFLYVFIFIFFIWTIIYYFQQAGGIVAYYTSHWASRFTNTGIVTMIMFNFKSLLPFILLFLGLFLYHLKNISRTYRLFIFISLILVFLSFVMGGSGRKLAILFIFGFFTYKISYNQQKEYTKYFLFLLIALFIMGQSLLFLRNSGFNFESLLNVFTGQGLKVFENVIMSSEPVGTYSISLLIIDAINSNTLSLGYFYEFSKMYLFIFEKLGFINIENIAFSLGKFYAPDVKNLTLFPTLLIEGYFNFSFIGAVFYSFIYIYLLKLLIINIYSSKNIYFYIFKNILFLIFFVQMIRGYFTACIGQVYIVIFLIIFIYLGYILINTFQKKLQRKRKSIV